MTNTPRIVQKIHFEDFAGVEFERLVYAYHVRAGWSDLTWYGQTGSDQGRDIVGNEPLDGFPSRKTIIQCVNRGAITQAKAERDMKVAMSAVAGGPYAFKFLVRGAVSAIRRDAIKAAADAIGLIHLTIWSGTEFEEHLRLIGEDLLRRFCAGESFPDDGEGIRRIADDFAGLSDSDTLTMMAAVFERPAFSTPFHQESSLPAFLRAIEDTIAALNTGLWRTREGVEIRRIPSLHHLRDPSTKAQVSNAAKLVDQLRRVFVSGLRDGRIRPCGCGEADCPVFMLDPSAARELDDIRRRALDAFRVAKPDFNIRLS